MKRETRNAKRETQNLLSFDVWLALGFIAGTGHLMGMKIKGKVLQNLYQLLRVLNFIEPDEDRFWRLTAHGKTALHNPPTVI